MTLLGRFAIVVLLLGLGFGWMARRRWGPLRGVRPWILALGLAPAYGVTVAILGALLGVESTALWTFLFATLALLGTAAGAVVWLLRDRPRWTALVPPGQALLQGAVTAALTTPFADVGASPPGQGSAAVTTIALLIAGAWLVWLPGRGSPPPRAPRGRSGRLRS